MRERFGQVAGGVQDVRCDDEVVRVQIEPLRRRVALDVEGPVLDRVAGVHEAGLRLRKEAGRNVREHIVEVARRQLGQHDRRAGTGARADLDDAHGPVLRPLRHSHGDGIRQQPVRGAGRRRGEVELGRARPLAAEQDGQRVHLAPEHPGERAAAPSQQALLVDAVGMELGDAVGEGFRVRQGVIRERVLAAHGDDIAAVGRSRQHAAVRKQPQHALEQPRVFGEDLQRLLQTGRVDSSSRLSVPA